jgi:hypothetical protein
MKRKELTHTQWKRLKPLDVTGGIQASGTSLPIIGKVDM